MPMGCQRDDNLSDGRRPQAQLSYRYASDTRNAQKTAGFRPLSICGAKNHCPFRGHLVLTGSTLMCWRRCSRNAVRTVGRRKSRLDHRFSLGALQSELPPPWHVWCLNRSAPHNALISSHIFSSGGKVGSRGPEAEGLGYFRPGRAAAARGDVISANDTSIDVRTSITVGTRAFNAATSAGPNAYGSVTRTPSQPIARAMAP